MQGHLLLEVDNLVRVSCTVTYFTILLFYLGEVEGQIEEPNSAIHLSYFSRSAAETVLLTFFIACSKSSIDVGVTSSSRGMLRMSSGFRPEIRRLIDIIAASLRQHAAGTFQPKLMHCYSHFANNKYHHHHHRDFQSDLNIIQVLRQEAYPVIWPLLTPITQHASLGLSSTI